MSNKHPRGLFTLFFTEMWERFGFYLMVGILVLYATDTERGGLALDKGQATEILGSYLFFVYLTPFLGGMIADRFLGFRLSVAIGGVIMAGGYFLLGVRDLAAFSVGLGLICIGNGLFKPNISAMVGNLYKAWEPKRDAGFNIFYMGINIGASISAFASAPLRNIYDFNVAFIAAGVGLLIGTSILLLNWKMLAVADVRSEHDPEEVGFMKIISTIILPAVAIGVLAYLLSSAGKESNWIKDSIGPITFALIAGTVPVFIYFIVLYRKARPAERVGLGALFPVFLCGGAFFMILHLSAGMITFFAEENTKRPGGWIPEAPVVRFYKQKAMPSYFKNADSDVPRPAEELMVVTDEKKELLYGSKILSEAYLQDILARNPDLQAVTDVPDQEADKDGFHPEWEVMTCKVFADENVKVTKEKDSHGKEKVQVKVVPPTAPVLRKVAITKEAGGARHPVFLVTAETKEKVYAQAAPGARLKPGEYKDLFNAEMVTGLFNPLFVVILTPLVVGFFTWLANRGRQVSTARKIFIGMVLTTISLLVMALAANLGGNGAAKVAVFWLVFYYLIITAGELCLSPMGLSLVTKLSPKRIVGLMMGGWFFSTAVGNKLSGFISGQAPTVTVFMILAGLIFLVAMIIFFLLPRLDRALRQYGA